MPAPIAKGPFSSNSHSYYNKTNAAPPGKGLMLLTAALIAAGYAVYENRDQVRDFMDRSRRKLSFAMHNFAEEIMPTEEEREMHSPFVARGRSSMQSSETIFRRESTTETENIINDEDEKAAGTGRDLGVGGGGNSTIRRRSQHRAALDDDDNDDDEHYTSENKIVFDSSAGSDAYYEFTKEPSDTTSDTLSRHEVSAPVEKESVETNENGLVAVPVVDQKQTVVAETEPEPATPVVEEEPEVQTPQPVDEQSFLPQPYWSIHEWNQTVHEDALTGEETEFNASSDPSLVGSDSEEDDGVDAVSDVDSSNDGSWSEVGSDMSDHEH